MATIRIEVQSLLSNKSLLKWVNEANKYLSIPVKSMEKVSFYKIEEESLDDDQLMSVMDNEGKDIFHDPIMERFLLKNGNYEFPGGRPSFVAEVGFRPGVTDNCGHAAKEGLTLLGLNSTVATGHVYFIFGDLNKDEATKVANELLANKLIQSIDIFSDNEYFERNRFLNVAMPKVIITNGPKTGEYNLEVSNEELLKINNDNCLALTLNEIEFIRDYYRDEKVRAVRKSLGLPQNPTDVELEVIAQTWSEHCKHKIFASKINYSEVSLKGHKELGSKEIDSLYKTFIKGSTKKIEAERGISWLKSVFSDNAGIVRFDEKVDLCIKAETHNSPSALDPYGGALTGILGVNRDILGCGLGAKPLANTDVFCFAPPDMPGHDEEELMPEGLKHPRRIFEGVHLGVEDGGNKSGIPTINGAIYFDKDFAGKPLVFVGTIGVMPQKLKDGTETDKKYAKPGDRIVMLGGEIGADGIHGATFSSLELNENSPATAVQIGDPLTQKRAMDFLLEARDLGLYSCITDNGAGGLSSSVGEMATLTGGAELDLKLCPVKYPGLKPFELMISESQERMTVAVRPGKINKFLELAGKRGVIATDLGVFNNEGFLKVKYGNELVANLDLNWLHDALPQMELEAKWDGPRERKTWNPIDRRNQLPTDLNKEFNHEALLKLLSTPNIASKEPWVRRYDHEVQAATHMKPFVGAEDDGPGDSGVIWLYPHGGEKENGVSVGCGLNPRLSLYDPYYMAQFAVDEAVRNVVATGGDIDSLCLLDNFCWPDPVQTARNPDGEYKLGQLVRSCAGLYDICNYYGTPLVSGKDSMKNDFRGKNKKGEELTISILPTLLVTAMARTKIHHTASSDFKDEGDLIYVIGESSNGLLGSELAELYNIEKLDSALPSIDIEKNKKLYKTYHTSLSKGLIGSCHDISDGGLLVAVAESCIGGRLGAKLDSKVDDQNSLDFLYSEGPGRFIVSVKPSNKDEFETLFERVQINLIGEVRGKDLIIETDGKISGSWNLDEMVTAWKREL